MEACNAYYYATRDPLGRGGDFTTAPEISQMFGEMVGAALADCWTRAERRPTRSMPSLGRAAGRWPPTRCGCCAAPASRARCIWSRPARCSAPQQAKRVPGRALARAHRRPCRPRRCCSSPTNSSTRLPIRQFVGRNRAAGRRSIGGRARLRPRRRDRRRFAGARGGRRGHRDAVSCSDGGVALIIDYGHARSAPGDTLQAVRGHRYAPTPGRSGRAGPDRACRFRGAAAQAARRCGATVTPARRRRANGCNRLGIEQRAQKPWSHGQSRASATRSTRRVDRLCRRGEMGELFKVMAIQVAGLAGSRRGLSHDASRYRNGRHRRRAPRSIELCAETLRRHLRPSLPTRAISQLSCANHARGNWRQELADPALRVPGRRGGRRGRRLRQARAAAAAVRAARHRRSSFASSICSGAWQGRGLADADDAMGDRRGRAARRQRALPLGLHRQSPGAAILRALGIRRGRAATTSWSAAMPTRTSSCGGRL